MSKAAVYSKSDTLYNQVECRMDLDEVRDVVKQFDTTDHTIINIE